MKKRERIKMMKTMKREITCSPYCKKFLEDFWKQNPNHIPALIYQPERLSPEDAIYSVCDSLNSVETQRERSEEVAPPTGEVGHESNRFWNLIYRDPYYSGMLAQNVTLAVKFAQAQAITQDTAIRNLLCTRVTNLGV